MDISILFENKNIIVVDKPSGLIVHSDGKTAEETLTTWFTERYPEAKGVGEEQRVANGKVVDRSGIVHRLDRDTSGSMILVKNEEAFLYYKDLFQKHSIKKTYNAFVYGWFKEDEGEIDRPLGRSAQDFRLWSAQRGARGKLREALTLYRVIEQGRDPRTNEPVSFLEIYPKTGRTHQIRAHMKAISHQIVSDPLYAPKRPKLLGLERLALHAYSLEFTSLEGEAVSVKAPLPEGFKKGRKMMILREE